MFRRTEMSGPMNGGATAGARGSSSDRPAPDPAPSTATAPSRPVHARTGALDSLLTTGPVFAARVHGYDRLEVDNYVAWAESELAAARSETEHLLARYGACAAELEIARRLLAEAPKGQGLSAVSDRVRDILRLAGEEASAVVEAATQEADQILAEARAESDERLRKAQEIRALVTGAADELRERAQRDREESGALLEQARADAAALLERARAEAADMIGAATAERDRLAAEAAEAAEALPAAQAEVDDVRRQRDDARAALRRLTAQIEAALGMASAGPAERFLLVDNTVVDQPARSPQGVSVPS